ncbi:putative transporter (YecA family protein with SEC-C motif)) [Bradyrhizobium sp. ORS 278]|uniref:YecA/YgfB family protein n=1 Tax=Bradyrhizobium sp. (strain ORS 278) TaxID=114615 RepID=UPI0001508138|nr:YecA family protein [Bradyrhizobium sp. ORS 278]CAL77766.1 putative transporter (YecA family protein with SEC-C motif)) [Bradyrhizobium sp. ORS 278]
MADQTNSHAALEQALLALDDRAMVLEELDGFIAGLLTLPEQVPAGEWFSAAFGLGKGIRSVFASIDHANAVLELVAAYHDEIARTLARSPELYQPRFPVERGGEVIWELWVEGFAAAVALRRERFIAYRQVGDDEVRGAALNLMMAIDAVLDEHSDPVELGRLSDKMAILARESVLTLYRHRQSGVSLPGTPDFAERPNPFASLGKTGRNDPCPCGSGQKFKRCCGAE